METGRAVAEEEVRGRCPAPSLAPVCFATVVALVITLEICPRICAEQAGVIQEVNCLPVLLSQHSLPFQSRRGLQTVL